MISGLIAARVIVPPLSLERTYRDQRFKAEIQSDGLVHCMGRSFHTLSSAACYARSTCTATAGDEPARLSSNGWAFWQFRNADGELESIRSLRRRYLRG